MPKPDKKVYTHSAALERLQRFCAYQDRCHQEVRQKLYKLSVYGDKADAVMADLIADNFLNEERFARSFARGRFKIKQWGRDRIRRELQQRQISDYCIRAAMQEIEPAAYQQTLQYILHKKKQLINAPNAYILRQKLAQYAIRRGFESALVWPAIDELLQEID